MPSFGPHQPIPSWETSETQTNMFAICSNLVFLGWYQNSKWIYHYQSHFNPFFGSHRVLFVGVEPGVVCHPIFASLLSYVAELEMEGVGIWWDGWTWSPWSIIDVPRHPPFYTWLQLIGGRKHIACFKDGPTVVWCQISVRAWNDVSSRSCMKEILRTGPISLSELTKPIVKLDESKWKARNKVVKRKGLWVPATRGSHCSMTFRGMLLPLGAHGFLETIVTVVMLKNPILRIHGMYGIFTRIWHLNLW